MNRRLPQDTLSSNSATKWYRPSTRLGMLWLGVKFIVGAYLAFVAVGITLGSVVVSFLYSHGAGPWIRDRVSEASFAYPFVVAISVVFSWLVSFLLIRGPLALVRSRRKATPVHGETTLTTELKFWGYCGQAFFIASAAITAVTYRDPNASAPHDHSLASPWWLEVVYWLAPLVSIGVFGALAFRLPRFDDGSSDKADSWPTSQRWQRSEQENYIRDLRRFGNPVLWSTESTAEVGREVKPAIAFAATTTVLILAVLFLTN